MRELVTKVALPLAHSVDMSAFTEALRAGDAVVARIVDEASGCAEPIDFNAVVVDASSVRTLGGAATMLVDVEMADGLHDRRAVPVANLLPQKVPRRFASRLHARCPSLHAHCPRMPDCVCFREPFVQ